MFNSVKLLSYISVVFLFGGCAVLDRALLPSSAKTEISVENKRVAVVVDACHYLSTFAFADNYFSKEDALADIEQISRGISSVFHEKKIRHKVFSLPFFCMFSGGATERSLKDKKGGTVIGSMADTPHPVAGELDTAEQQLRDSFLSLGCQYWQYREDRLGIRVASVDNAANLYQCKKRGYTRHSAHVIDDIPELKEFDYLLIVNNFFVSATLARAVISLSGPPPSYSSAAIYDLKEEKFVWDDFRNLKSKCWVSGGFDDYPTVRKPIGGLVCE